MKSIITRLATLTLTFIAMFNFTLADAATPPTDYTALWSKFAKAFEDDLPKSALATVQEIRDHALAEDNQGQLLRALCTEWTIACQISRDSDEVVVRRIEQIVGSEQRPVELALWRNVLGRIKGDAQLIKASLAETEMLAEARATDYLPAFVVGKDSHVYNNDLLSVLTHEAESAYCLSRAEREELSSKMRAHYESQGNEIAVLIEDFRLTTSRYSQPDEIGALIGRIRAKVDELRRMDRISGGAAAATMQQWIAEQEQPKLACSWRSDENVYYPGESAKLTVSSNNFPSVELRIYRVKGVTNATLDGKTDWSKLIKSRKKTELVSTVNKELKHAPAHETFDDELTVTLPESGIYVAAPFADGKMLDAVCLHVSNLSPVFFKESSNRGDRARLVLVEAVTGQPIKEDVGLQTRPARRHSSSSSDARSWRTIAPYEDGSFDLSGVDSNDEIAVSAGSNVFHPVVSFPFGRRGYFHDPEMTSVNAKIFTDRAIYRPGQKVQLGGMVYSRLDDEYKPVVGLDGKVVLQNADRKDIAEISVSTDDFGQFNGEFTLPDPAVPGRFAVIFRSKSARTTEYVSVEEYKRPTFRVSLEAPDCKDVLGRRDWAVGDTLRLQGKVETFSGMPVPDAEVKWSTEYSDWSWLRRYDRADGTVGEGTLKSDAEGRFSIDVVFSAEGHYRTSVEATAANGETASAAHSVFVGHPYYNNNEEEADDAPKLFDVQTNKAGDEATLTLDLRALDQKAQRPVFVFYDVVSTDGGSIKSERRTLQDDRTDFCLKWREEYGDGARGYVAFVKNGRLYSQSFCVQRPLPDKRLLMAWSTFRDHLQPGEQETWTLSVKHPDGKPADARVMARLYDASLDAFVSNPWRFSLDFNRALPYTESFVSPFFNPGMNCAKVLKWKRQRIGLDLTHWEPTMFDYWAILEAHSKTMLHETVVLDSKRALFKSAAATNGVYASRMEAPMMAESIASPTTDAFEDVDAEMEEAAAEAMSVQVRENFDETAFFVPCLRTDADGNVALSFTLPESLTQWNFTALAHDKKMNYGILNDTIVARKMLTAEVAAPRFLRQGDKTDLPITVRNLSEESLAGELIVAITDAKTGKVLKTEKRHFSLATKNAQVTEFFALEAGADVRVRAVAKTAEFSDGEERLIPYIDGRETIQATIPFSTREKGNVSIDLSSLNLDRLMKQDPLCKPQLTVEYSANPIWNVIRVVPALLEGEAISATDWAVRLYTIEVADFLAQQLKSTESAQLIDSLLTTKDIPALRYSALDRLRDYQLGDGGFSWFKGFHSSLWITTDVGILLARQQKMTGSRTAQSMLDKAVAYMEAEVTKWVEEMKKNKAEAAPETLLRYLYVRQLLGLEPDKNAKYLMDLAAKEKKNLTMYGKSAVAQILHKSHPAASLLALQSLVEFSVSTAEMGRYFDTERALGGWASYKIPTQTMAIEALASAEADGVKAIPGTGESTATLKDEMQLWLLQSKRTQQWESSRASADATYALLHGYSTMFATDAADPQAPSSLFQALSPEGYSKRQLTPEENDRAIKTHSYNIIKDNDGLSWGAVYADYTLPAEQVEASSAGFTLTRQWEVLRDGQWMPLNTESTTRALPASNGKARKGSESKADAVKPGEHVRQVFTLRADRDYDFVQVEASRAACLQPLQPLSGHCWLGQTSAYRMVRDSRNDYFFEHLAKGTHTFTEELVVDRSGTFTTGIARVQCTYAPEFSAYAPSAAIIANRK